MRKNVHKTLKPTCRSLWPASPGSKVSIVSCCVAAEAIEGGNESPAATTPVLHVLAGVEEIWKAAEGTREEQANGPDTDLSNVSQ
jgi:hypothetical protein